MSIKIYVLFNLKKCSLIRQNLHVFKTTCKSRTVSYVCVQMKRCVVYMYAANGTDCVNDDCSGPSEMSNMGIADSVGSTYNFFYIRIRVNVLTI